MMVLEVRSVSINLYLCFKGGVNEEFRERKAYKYLVSTMASDHLLCMTWKQKQVCSFVLHETIKTLFGNIQFPDLSFVLPLITQQYTCWL